MQKKKNKICVITLTYNRPGYIERSFDSLYKRAGCEFDHYVYDDCSDKNTIRKLKSLKRKYKFELFLNKNQFGIYKSFHKLLDQIPYDYDFFVKFDSDIEILSDNFFTEILEISSFPKFSGATPRVEGVINSDRYEGFPVNYYNGHCIKFNAPVVYGCCLIFPASVFISFPKKDR